MSYALKPKNGDPQHRLVRVDDRLEFRLPELGGKIATVVFYTWRGANKAASIYGAEVVPT